MLAAGESAEQIACPQRACNERKFLGVRFSRFGRSPSVCLQSGEFDTSTGDAILIIRVRGRRLTKFAHSAPTKLTLWLNIRAKVRIENKRTLR